MKQYILIKLCKMRNRRNGLEGYFKAGTSIMNWSVVGDPQLAIVERIDNSFLDPIDRPIITGIDSPRTAEQLRNILISSGEGAAKAAARLLQ
jgi:hypothetical protein